MAGIGVTESAEEAELTCTQSNSGVPNAIVSKRLAGFDCEFIERPQEAFQADCPICLLVLREPQQVSCCGYSYCQPCIAPILEAGKPCPTCNVAGFSSFPNIGLKRSLCRFSVRCSHQREGCQWTGELGELESHLNESPQPGDQLRGCPYSELQCCQCAEYFPRQGITTHEIEECPQRPFSCDYCGDYDADYESVVTKHWPTCGFRPVPCPNGCGVYPERQNLERHVSSDCPLSTVNCDFHFAGCGRQLSRKDMPSHLSESVVHHLSLLAVHNQKRIDNLEHETRTLKETLVRKDEKIAELERKLAPFFPISFTMTNISDHKRDRTTWYSPSFYTHPHGYLVRLYVTTTGTHMAIGVQLMQGEFDEFLRWPFRGIAVFEIVNQLKDSEHYRYAYSQSTARATTEEPYQKSGRVLPYSMLEYDPATECQYLKDDCLRLRVIQVTNTGWHPIEKQCLAIESLVCVTPIEFTMQGFEQLRRTDDLWLSPPFYTHPHGYRMRLHVIANELCAARSTHVSLFIYLMRGEFDSYVKWPFRGKVSLQLLNQFADERHRNMTICFTDATPDSHAGRVLSGERGRSWGDQKFISHSKLGCNSANDCLHFRVTSVVLAT